MMRRGIFPILAGLLAGAPLSAQLPVDVLNRDTIAITEIGWGVHAVIRQDPPGLMFEANSGFIVTNDGVIVVDGGSNPESSRQLIAALRRITAAPVTHLIHTHWHDDHHVGATEWKAAYPALQIVAHRGFMADLAAEGKVNRQGMAENGPDYAASIEALVQAGRTGSGRALTPEEITSHTSTVHLARKALRQIASYTDVAPDILVDTTYTLKSGGRTIVLRWLGRAHTSGDLVVHMPEAGIVFTGDLVAYPTPLVGSTSYPLDFGGTLDGLIALGATTIVPGHGPVLRDDSYLRTTAELLHHVAAETRAAVARGETLEQARSSIVLEPFRTRIAGDSPLRRFLFDTYVTSPAIARAYEAATAGAR